MAKKVITKTEFVNQLAKVEGISNKDALSFFNSMVKLIYGNVEKGNEIAFQDFMQVKIRTRAQRKGRNPQTGESIIIPERTVVCMKPAAKLRNVFKEEK